MKKAMGLPTGKRPGGRRVKRTPKPGERVTLSVRVLPELKRAIDDAAAARGWSQGHEVEYRLTHTTDREGLLFEALSLRHGPLVGSVLVALSDTLRHLAQIGGSIARRERHEWDIDNWLDNPRAFEAAVEAINAALKELHPDRRGLTPWPAEHRNPAANWLAASQYSAYLAMFIAHKSRALLPGKQRREEEKGL